MKRYSLHIAAGLAALLVAGVASAGTGLFSKPAACGTDPCVVIDYETGSGDAPTDKQPDGGIIGTNWNADGGVLPSTLGLGPQSGLRLDALKGFTVTVMLRGGNGLDAGGSFTAGTLRAYLYDPAVAVWVRAGDLDVTVEAALTGKSFPGWDVPAQFGSIMFVPYGLGQPSRVVIHGKR